MCFSGNIGIGNFCNCFLRNLSRPTSTSAPFVYLPPLVVLSSLLIPLLLPYHSLSLLISDLLIIQMMRWNQVFIVLACLIPLGLCLPQCDLNILQQCSQASLAGTIEVGYYYGFRAPLYIRDQPNPAMTVVKFGYSKADNFYRNRYDIEFGNLLASCLVDLQTGQFPPVGVITPVTTRTQLKTLMNQNPAQFNTVLRACVRRHMSFEAAVRCRADEKCLDMRFVCAIDRLTNQNGNKKVRRQEMMHGVTLLGRKVDISFYRGKVPYLVSGHTEFFEYYDQVNTIPQVLHTLLTDSK